jgi:hypothetical protein
MPLLFSYGTLQQEEVQLAIFDRKLRGDQDELVGYDLASGREAWVYVDARIAGSPT